MATAVLVLGKSGSGKSASMRNMEKVALFNVNNKPLPFANNDNVACAFVDDFIVLNQYLDKAVSKGYKSIVIDDAGYLMVKKFMENHRGAKGNNQFDLYNEIGDNFYNLIKKITNNMPKNVIVYVMMHEDKNDFGDVKPKTIGKLLDDKVCIEGMFSIVIRSLKQDGHHVFVTRTDGLDVTKTPMGMFDEQYIDNDLSIVDKTIRNYYKLDEEVKNNG